MLFPPTPPLEVNLFGAFELRVHGENVAGGTLAARRVLALLVLRPTRPLERLILAGELWPNAVSGERAQFYLRRALTELRQFLGSEAYRLESPTPATIRFDLTECRCDVTAFDAAVQTLNAPANNADLAQRLETAGALYRAQLLEAWDEPWVLAERESRAQSILEVRERLAALRREGGQLAAAARLLHQVLAADPLRESACCSLMETLSLSGDFAGVEREYRSLRRRMRDDMGIEPSEATRAIYQTLLQSGRAAPPVALPPLKSASLKRRLPVPLTSLVGRDLDTEEAAQTLRHHRLVTLVGPGGVGKTRLSLAIGERVASEFAEGVWFVELASITSSSQIWHRAAATLGIALAGVMLPEEAVCFSIGERRLLLILDNAEHLTEYCAHAAVRLLQDCPNLRVLVTSRQVLRVSGESVYSVSPLATSPLPPPGGASKKQSDEWFSGLNLYPAATLLLERATSVSHRFRLTRENAEAVSRICRHVDGIPLALELAAAQFRTLSPIEIADRLTDPLPLLHRGDRTVPRQQTLQATMDWSYRLLAPPEQNLLARLSVFSGGWTEQAAASICSGNGVSRQDIPDLLASLAEHSLIVTEEVNGRTRYRFLETIREYSQQHLERKEEGRLYRRRHSSYFAKFAFQAEPRLYGYEAAETLDLIEGEMASLQGAMTWLRQNRKAARSLRIAVALEDFWIARGGLRAGAAAMRSALEANIRGGDLRRGIRRKGNLSLAWLEVNNGNFSEARRLLRRALRDARMSDDSADTIRALRGLGYVFHQMGANRRAEPLWRHALNLARATNNAPRTAQLLHDLGNHAKDRSDLALAETLYEESISLHRTLGRPRGIAMSMFCKGAILITQGRNEEAVSALEESLVLAKARGDQTLSALVLRFLGHAWLELGDFRRSQTIFEHALSINQERGVMPEVSNLRISLAHVLRLAENMAEARDHLRLALAFGLRHGDRRHHYFLLQETVLHLTAANEAPEKAAVLIGAVEYYRELLAAEHYTGEMPKFPLAVSVIRATMDEEAFSALWSWGYAMSQVETGVFLANVLPTVAKVS